VLLVMVMIGLLWRTLKDLGVRTGRDAERVLTAIALVGTFVAVAVVGAFDAVLLIAVPTFFLWTLAGALASPGAGGIEVERGVRRFGPVLVLALGAVAVGRSALQLAAIATFSTTNKTTVLERASLLDPGSYRIHVKLAQGYRGRGDCSRAVAHARAARRLFPNAAEPRRELAACGTR
jgi:hypothetical protein